MPTSDEYTIDLTSAAGNSEADYEVTALASTKVTPAYGPQASTVTVSGKNFPKIAGIEILVTMGATEMGTAKTLSDGTFSKAFKVPAIADGTYTLNALARDEDTEDPYNVADGTNFKVGTMNIILSDDEGPTGTTIGITGNGFTPNETWNATIGDEELEDCGQPSVQRV